MIFVIAGRELRSLFGSPTAWVVLAVLQFILAYLFLSQIDGYLAIQPQLGQLANPPGVTEAVAAPTFGSAAVVLLMVTPLFSMRLISEERRNRTLPLLLSAPVSMTEIILGKFLGLLGFLGLIVVLLTAMVLSLYAGGKLDLGLLTTNVLGLLLLVGSFAALGLYISSLTAQPLVAAVGSLGALLGLWIVNLSARDPDSVLHYLSLLKHFERFNQGVVAAADLVYFGLFIGLFLVLSIRRLDIQRLRG
jgi:ABC-2 type transport system permease protein